ncbi:hypothetical protein NGM99_00235 [Mesorhizobium sp. RP14(2022)]|uniref:Uncharacterized protein n=1 Tax=Mesorhizobium liriopis TaxID=2953882 RepID=A0ABT1C2H4_9HYPH|nr:hypothetical protein [Mesorhizobium liriopis]MCO6048216.1 hypothetical protein [Mesorhizobium liriopis]
MGNRSALITKADATRLFEAARRSGFRRACVISHLDGRVEMVAEDCCFDEESVTPKNDWDDVLK